MDLDSINPRPTGHHPTTILRTMDGRTLTLKHGEAAEPLNGDTHNIDTSDATSAIWRLAFYALDNEDDARAYARYTCSRLMERPTIGAVLSNRIYRDRIDCPDEA